MTGSLTKRGKSGIWYARIRIHGEQKTIRLGRMTKADAERAMRTEIDRRERSMAGGDRKITFKALAELWLDNHKLDKKPKTIDSYDCLLTKHIVPFFGRMVVSAIRPEDVSKFRQAITGKVSVTTVNYNLRLLRSVLDTGIRLGYAFDNAAKLVPKLKPQKKRHEGLSRQDVRSLLDKAKTIVTSPAEQARVLIMFAIMTGARMGEILAATWKNVNWPAGTCLISESYSPFGLDSPKTEASYRTIDLPPILLKALREHRVIQAQYRLRMGERYQNHDLIFATEAGTFINPSNLRNRIFFPALAAAELPRIRFHDLRGVYTTLMLESGAPLKYVQDQLGHKTPGMTLGVYAKVTREAQTEALKRFDQFLVG